MNALATSFSSGETRGVTFFFWLDLAGIVK
jgi:hypothetical protein